MDDKFEIWRPEFKIQVQGPITQTVETDPKILLKLLRNCCKSQHKMLQRLKKARRQRDEARAKIIELENKKMATPSSTSPNPDVSAPSGQSFQQGIEGWGKQ